MSHHSTIDISLLGREYRVTCAPNERESLLAAVAHVEAKMNEISTRTKGSGERLAVMTALNLAHELLSRKEADAATIAHTQGTSTIDAAAPAYFDSPEIARTMNSLMARMDALMTRQESLL